MFSKNGTDSAGLMGESGSIAARLTFWYALLSVVLIASAGSVLYWVLTDRLRQEDDQMLAGRIAEIRAILLHPTDSAIFRDELQREAAMLPGTYIRLLNSQGAIVVEAPTSHAVFGHRKVSDPFSQITGDDRGADWLSDEGEVFRIMSSRVAVGSGFTVQVAMSRTKEAEVIAAYRRTLWVTVSAALAIAIVLGYLIARRGLQPVSRLASIVAELSAAHLHRRMADDAWPRELRPLATNFDQLLAHLEESFARISRFSADIAHELRTPLHILRGEAEMALSKARSSEGYRACIESAAEEYERLTRMVDALLFLARTEQPDAQLDKKSLTLDQELTAVCAFHQAMADEQEVFLTASGAGIVLAESSLLRRALGNLIVNALRHTPSGGRIVVEAKEIPDRETEIIITDTGEGIAPEDLPHVFDRFYRADSARLRQGAGTGLGLAIVRSIMQLHSGTVSLRSELGRGTAVTLKFPPS